MVPRKTRLPVSKIMLDEAASQATDALEKAWGRFVILAELQDRGQGETETSVSKVLSDLKRLRKIKL